MIIIQYCGGIIICYHYCTMILPQYFFNRKIYDCIFVEIMAETTFHTMFSVSQSLFALDEGVSFENVGM